MTTTGTLTATERAALVDAAIAHSDATRGRRGKLPHADVYSAIEMLLAAGFTASTAVDPYRAARELTVWRPGTTPLAMGPNATLRLSASDGRATGATVQFTGEEGPTDTVRGRTAVLDALTRLYRDAA